MEIAGLPIPEGNRDRRGGLNLNPGTDSEGEELKERAAENADTFGGEGGDTAESSRDAAAAAAPVEPTPPPESEKKGPSFTTVDMTHTKRLHVIPGFDEDNATKTMFLLVLELPGGLVAANPILNEDLMGAKMDFVELGQAFDAAFLFREIAGRAGQGHIISHVREDMEQEMVEDETLVRGANNQMTRSVDFVFPEKADTYLFNPFTRQRGDPVYVRHIPGGRTVCMTAVWQARETPIFRGVDNDALSEQEQLDRAHAFFPGIRNRFQAGGGGGQQRGDAQLLADLNRRVDQQEARLRREYARQMEDQRNRMQARVANMTGDQIRNLTPEVFRNLFNELGAELGTGDGDGDLKPRAEGRAAGRAGRPVRVETVEEEMDLSDL